MLGTGTVTPFGVWTFLKERRISLGVIGNRGSYLGTKTIEDHQDSLGKEKKTMEVLGLRVNAKKKIRVCGGRN